jgi:hypothetical protein
MNHTYALIEATFSSLPTIWQLEYPVVRTSRMIRRLCSHRWPLSGSPLHFDRLIAAQLLIVEPQLEIYIGWSNQDPYRVLDAKVVLLRRPEVFVLLDKFSLVSRGKVRANLAQDTRIWPELSRSSSLDVWKIRLQGTYADSSDLEALRTQGCFQRRLLGTLSLDHPG